MWPRDAIQRLSNKIEQVSPEKFDYYLNQFFILLTNLLGEESIPPGILLGVTEKLFTKYYQANNYSIPLNDFMKQLIGLAIVYTKYELDDAVWNEDLRLDQYPALKQLLDEPISRIEVNILNEMHHSLTIDLKNLAKALANLPDSSLIEIREELISNIRQQPSPYNNEKTSPLYELIKVLDEFINDNKNSFTQGYRE